MSGMTPERLLAIEDRLPGEVFPNSVERDVLNLLAEVKRLRAGIEALHAHAHRTHDHGWGQLLDVVLNPDGEDLAEYIAMHEADSTEGEADAC